MLRPRIIPCLLIKEGGLVKTVKFRDPKYVGDPINAVRIFNEKEADELLVLDIDATAHGREPDYQMISHLAAECRMPVCYGGGVRYVHQIEKIIELGVEKVAIGAAALKEVGLIEEAARRVGSQSLVVVMDVRRGHRLSKRGYSLWSVNGRNREDIDPIDFARAMEAAGAGEIVVNSIDRDGEMKGYDLELAKTVRNSVRIPVTILGGAGSIDEIKSLFRECGVLGAAAGSLFVFKGRYRAVLISYPDPVGKRQICQHAQLHTETE